MKNNLKFLLHDFLIPNYWVFNFAMSLFLLWLSPMILMFWLIFFSICLKYFKKLTWNSFIKTWLPIFTLWYLILIFNLGKYSPIIIGPGYTKELMGKALSDGIYFERICFSTILLLHMFSTFLGVPIIIPVIFNVFKKIWGTDCAENNDPTPPQKPSLKSNKWFSSGDTQNQKDAETCGKLADNMSNTRYFQPFYKHESVDSENGQRVTHNVSSWFPGFGALNFCISFDKKNLGKYSDKN